MPVLIEYLLKVSIALAVVYLFYQLVLRRLTFYNWNRWYLVGYSLLCFAIPFMNITDFLFRHELEGVQLIRFIPVYDLQIKDPGFEWSRWTIAIAVLTTGVLIMGVRMLLQLLSLQRIKTKATLLNEGEVKLFHVDEHIIPFSFNNGIYINRLLHTEAELQEIIRHEFVHVKQKHSIDILFAELLCMLLWFHPAVWLIRKAIRQNLEFIADENVLQDGIDKKQYQYLLLKVVGNNHFSIAPNFNFSSLKNRIIMMNQNQSARVQAIRFLFILPLIAVLLLAFREVKEQRIFSNNKPLVTDTVPPPPPPALPSGIESMNVFKEKNTVVIKLKNGKKETYNLNDAKQKEIFEKKYGELKPPPPPAAPAPPEIAVTTPAHEQALINTKGYYVTIADNHGECIVIVKDKDKKIIEALKLTDWDAKETEYKNKYGDIPPPPPPTAPSMVSVAAPVSIATTVSPVSKLTGTIAPTVAIHGVKSNVAIVSEVSTLAPVTTPVPVPPVSVESKLTIATSPVMVEQKTVTPKLQLNVSGVNGFPTGALYYIDGKEASYENVEKLNPDFIESISILKGESATKTYGEKGRNGVILIKTKK